VEHFRDGEMNVKDDQEIKIACSTILLKLAARSAAHF
jgi:hypothetical protein